MTLQAILKSQYDASLAMLQEAIQVCPPELWVSAEYRNQFWQVAYHTLFYTHFYLQSSESVFVAWEHHRPGLHCFDSSPIAGALMTPYSPEELSTYCRQCQNMVDSAVDALELTASESGFPWYRMSKLEHQLVNLRHLQHHTGQLIDRLRQTTNRGVQWKGGGSES